MKDWLCEWGSTLVIAYFKNIFYTLSHSLPTEKLEW